MELLGSANTTIQGDPAHHFRVHKVACSSTYLPDATISFIPVSTNMLNQGTHQIPEWPFQRFTVALKASMSAIQMNAIEDLAEDIQLLLVCRAVANTNGT